jgi:alpha-L-fucosidase
MRGVDRDPTWRELGARETPQWLSDGRFGIWFHWAPHAVPAHDNEWYPRDMYNQESDIHDHHVETYGDPAEFGYHDFVPEFTGEHFDAERWADFCAEAGANYAGMTAIHHDGFALWDSDLTEWNAAEKGPQRDVLGEFAQAVRDRGMKFVAAFHHAWTWWYYPRVEGYPTMDPAYADLYDEPHEPVEQPPESYYADWRDTTLEAVDATHPDALWFDFGWGVEGFIEHDEYRKDLIAQYYDRAAEWGKDVTVFHKRNLPVGVGTLDYERSRREDIATEPWLTDTSIDKSAWGYVEDHDFKDVRTLVTGFVDRVSKNGSTFLNIGPKADGTLPDVATDRVREFGEWLETNADAFDESSPWWTFGEGPTTVTSGSFEEASNVEFTGQDVRFTRTDEAAYAHLMDWPEDGKVTIKTNLNHRISGKQTPLGLSENVVAPSRVDLLGADVELEWSLEEDGLHVSLPDSPPAALTHVYALEVAF